MIDQVRCALAEHRKAFGQCPALPLMPLPTSDLPQNSWVSPQIPTTAADCHMGNRIGLMYPAPPSPIALGLSATLVTQTWAFTFFPDIKLQKQWSTNLLGVSFDATVGKSGNLELGIGAKNTGAGLNFYNGNEVGGSGHFGPSIPASFVYGSVVP